MRKPIEYKKNTPKNLRFARPNFSLYEAYQKRWNVDEKVAELATDRVAH